ncbi:hypothetical protein GCM10008014_24910 [Paenibacillus silvae]|uniref:YbjN domain-containing protein n=1 Tax=Paenibacillus silvae TaxID=1325358 RepID=A0ABQ1ZAC4_9BACL|nr:hypothetical protein [Paenibacillus silvae]GGH55364.1 hypothetical protein GCM10008014_24910 [Paenibacillus silvae]
MITKNSLSLSDVMELLNNTPIEYSEVTVQDEKVIQVNLVRQRDENDDAYIVEVNLVIQERPQHLFIYCHNIYDIKHEDSVSNVLRELSIVNLKRVIYGNMGFDDSDNSITYTNSVSLAGRESLTVEEIMDYIFYAGFICDKISLHLTRFEEDLFK